jgi:hypothetical protein
MCPAKVYALNSGRGTWQSENTEIHAESMTARQRKGVMWIPAYQSGSDPGARTMASCAVFMPSRIQGASTTLIFLALV